MRRYRQVTGSILCLLLLMITAFWLLPSYAAPSEQNTTTVLFTHDLHSHFLPQIGENGEETGGYGRLMTVLEEQRQKYPDALTLDGGDFSVGSLIQALYTREAPELRTMGAMGFDATTAGNHEFDHTGLGFAEMLLAARQSNEVLPALLMANYQPAPENPDQLDIQRAMAIYGVQESMLLERGGVTYGIFGLMGEDSDACTPESGFLLEDPVQAAKRCVERLKEQGAEFIICLSHSGTNEKESKSEDVQLAKKVDGIDLIVSGHTHTTLTEPIVVDSTYIVSAGPYCENLGSITLSWDENGKTLVDYQLIPIDESVESNPEVDQLVQGWKEQVSKTYLAPFGLTYDGELTQSTFPILEPEKGVQEGNALGELVSDAYLWAVQQAEGEDYVPVSLTVIADGVLRASLPSGSLTTSQAFDVLSMGVGADGSSGFPLVSCYLTGEEIWNLLEVDASITPIMPEAQLYCAGVEYTINPRRILLNRVSEANFVNEYGVAIPIEDDQLYRVVSGMYSAQMLGTVKDKSFGLLSIVPKDANGNPIEDFSEHIIYRPEGGELKEWYALASYLQSFGEEGVPQNYAQSDGRKQVVPSLNPIELFKNPNRMTIVVFVVVILVVLLVVYFVYRARKGRRYRRRNSFF